MKKIGPNYRAVLLIIALAFATGSTVAQTLEQSRTAYENKDYANAFAGFKKLAEQGNAEAQFSLGEMYMGGKSVARDDREAVSWLRKAADQGYASAQANLGFIYETGRGVPKDDRQAVAWYRKAADQGDDYGQYSLAHMYINGAGVPKVFVPTRFGPRLPILAALPQTSNR